MTPRSVLNISSKSNIQPMFLGDGLSLQRFDNPRHPFFLESFKQQMGNFWRPERIDLTRDRADYEVLSSPERHIFLKNIQYQALLDSVISRSTDALMAYVSLPELEAAINCWRFFETIHSYSYTYLVQNAIPNPSAVFDDVLKDREIVARAEAVKRDYDDLLNFTGGDVRKEILMALISTQILEGVRFYLSFACGFYFAEPPQGRMEGNAKILREICRDENLHVELIKYIVNVLRTDKSEGFTEVWKECRQMMIEMFAKAANEEKAWAHYLFSKGQVFGINADVMCGYIEFLTDQRMEPIGLGTLFNHAPNPIGGWLVKHLDSHSVQTAPQETEITSYMTGAVKSDLNVADFAF